MIKGVWVWDVNLLTEYAKIIDFVRGRCESIFLWASPNTVKANMLGYDNFIRECNNAGIKVMATYGDPLLVFNPNKVEEFFNTIEGYNKTYTKFDGVNLDIEPYLTDLWRSESTYKYSVLCFQSLILKCMANALRVNLPVGFVIPFWLDSKPCPTGNLLQWVVQNTDELCVMSYRDSATGIISLVGSEFMYANTYNKKLNLSVETTKQDPSYISFFGRSKEYLQSEMEKVNSKFISNASYGGICIHDIKGWMALEGINI